MLHGRTLERATTHLWVDNWLSVASTCLCYYDYLLCFDRELTYIWCRPLTVAKFLYVVNRYLCLLEIPLSVMSMQPGINPKFCQIWSKEVLAIETISAGVLSSILILRTWMDWNRPLPLLYCLSAFCALCLVSKVGILIRVIIAARASHNIDYGYRRRCAFVKKHSLLFPFHTITSTMIFVTFILGAIRFPKRASARYRKWSEFVCALIGDGFFYLCVIFAAAVVHLILWVIPATNVRNMFVFPFRVLGSIMGARIIFDLIEEHRPGMKPRAPACGMTKDTDYHDEDNCESCNGEAHGSYPMESRVSTMEFTAANLGTFEARSGPYSYDGGSPTISAPPIGDLDWQAACQRAMPSRCARSYPPSIATTAVLHPVYATVPESSSSVCQDPKPGWIKSLHDPHASPAWYKVNRCTPKNPHSDGLSFEDDFDEEEEEAVVSTSAVGVPGEVGVEVDGNGQRAAVEGLLEAGLNTTPMDVPTLKQPKPPDRSSSAVDHTE